MNHCGDYGLWSRACFDPVTLTVVGGTMAAASLAGSAMTAMGQMRQGQGAQAAANYNAQIDRINAQQEVNAGAQQAGALYEDRRARIASAKAASFGTGQDPTQGSPLEVLADLAGKAKQDEETVRWNAWNRAQRYAADIPLQKLQGQNAMSAARGAMWGTLLSAPGNALSAYNSGMSLGAGSRTNSATPQPAPRPAS